MKLNLNKDYSSIFNKRTYSIAFLLIAGIITYSGIHQLNAIPTQAEQTIITEQDFQQTETDTKPQKETFTTKIASVLNIKTNPTYTPTPTSIPNNDTSNESSNQSNTQSEPNNNTNDTTPTATPTTTPTNTPTPRPTAIPTATPTTAAPTPTPTPTTAPTATPTSTPSNTETISVNLSPNSPSTPSASGNVTITIIKHANGYWDYQISGSFSNLKPQTQYKLAICNNNCSSNNDAKFTTNDGGSGSVNTTLNHNHNNDAANRVSIWEPAVNGQEVPDQNTHCTAITTTSPACLQGNF